MRLFLASFAIAALCLYPQIAEVQDWQVPGGLKTLLFVPAAGLSYLEVFFHELGHTAAFWSYAQPAVPAFNFADGGGVAQPFMNRSLILQWIIYAGAGAAGFWLFRHGIYNVLAGFAALVLLHAAFAFGENYLLVVNYMGHGGSALVGCFCIWRAALNKTYSEHSPTAERYINMIFGLYVVMSNLFLSWKIIASDIARDIYLEGIGGHLANDFTVIADQLMVSVERVAAFSCLFVTGCLLVTAVVTFRGWREQQYEVVNL
jgi:hypothetical protein